MPVWFIQFQVSLELAYLVRKKVVLVGAKACGSTTRSATQRLPKSTLTDSTVLLTGPWLQLSVKLSRGGGDLFMGSRAVINTVCIIIFLGAQLF